MSPAPEARVELARREFRRLKQLADGAIAHCSDVDFFACPAVGDNSVGVIVKHVTGNLVSRCIDFLTTDGEKPTRARDAEFALTGGDTRATLLQIWERGWRALFDRVAAFDDIVLTQTVLIRGESLTVWQAILRQLTHCAYHIGQMVYLAKHYCGAEWQTLIILRGASAEFNRRPAPCLANPTRESRCREMS